MNADQVFVFLMTALITTGVVVVSIAAAIIRSKRRQEVRAQLPADLTERLGRMEQGIDAIAIEVERVSEAQRFVTKLLAERKAPAASIPERVITPH